MMEPCAVVVIMIEATPVVEEGEGDKAAGVERSLREHASLQTFIGAKN